jgi:hypothetical protein
MAWIICPNERCGEKFALSDETESFARAHEGLTLVCPFGHALWPFPAAMADKPPESPAKAPKPKRVLPVTESEQTALDEPREATEAVHPGETANSQGVEASQEEVPDEASADELPKELQTLITATETAGSWADVKEAIGAFQKGTLWPTLSPEQQNHIRRSAWETLTERGVSWMPDPAHDLSAFRLWIEATDTAAEIKATLALLQADPGFLAKGEVMRLTVAQAANERIEGL